MSEKKLNGTVIVTYRCNARCSMCNRYKAPSKPEEEISIETIKKLPKMYFTNITGGEPFIRTDLKDIVRELYKKSDRIVISTNGFFTDRIIDLAKEFPQIGIHISIEGLEKTNTLAHCMGVRASASGAHSGSEPCLKLHLSTVVPPFRSGICPAPSYARSVLPVRRREKGRRRMAPP